MGIIKGEIITAREALDRVGLDISLGCGDTNYLVEWRGYPKPFACGHTAKGEGDTTVRVNQAYASGPMLYSWQRIGKGENNGGAYFYHLASSLVVSIQEKDGRTILVPGVTA
jgi:hypothetical protein